MIIDADINRIVSDAFDAGYELSLLKRTIGCKPSLTKMEAEDIFTKGVVGDLLKEGAIRVERSETNRLIIETMPLIREYTKYQMRKAAKVRVAEKIKQTT